MTQDMQLSNRIKALICDSPIGHATFELCDITGRGMTTVRFHLDALRADGKIERTGASKHIVWVGAGMAECVERCIDMVEDGSQVGGLDLDALRVLLKGRKTRWSGLKSKAAVDAKKEQLAEQLSAPRLRWVFDLAAGC